MLRFLAISLPLALIACASSPESISFVPMDRSQFTSPQSQQQALHIASNDCRAQSLQAATGVRMPTMPSTQTTVVNVNNRYPTTAPSGGAAGGVERGVAIGNQLKASRQRDDLERATYIACMNRNGFVAE